MIRPALKGSGKNAPPSVHPFADRFPMLPDDDLAELAADIKANGLIHPIVIDADGQLIDGRNRLRACEIAGVEPVYTTLDGHDPIAYILSTNIERRHLSKGQRAMLAAEGLQLFSEKLRTGGRQVASVVGVNESQVSYAVLVLKHAPDLADAVIAGALSLNDAYEQARAIKLEREAEQDRLAREAREAAGQLDRLRAEAPDIAELVIEGRQPLREAIAALDERQRIEREQNERLTSYLVTALTTLASASIRSPADLLNRWDQRNRANTESDLFRSVWTPDGLRSLADWCNGIASEMEARKE